ncbi:hypothetical protein [Dethiosulfatarculus sandiegensis]|uniref:Uncharacterized protein n=1 Tax=Dethiosulfatarculus sandiegensis TaxID=1429043 RepID=A0A0D2J7T4_9BACT|nr:hypothetical protein [Dethiosulfatarculus sandiegensis]KIX11786.1 hypothetical protein X474_23020 [Dethiosulfatarculus sandiegensis]
MKQVNKLKRQMKALKKQGDLGIEETFRAKQAWRQKALALHKVSNKLKRTGINTKNLAAHHPEFGQKKALC